MKAGRYDGEISTIPRLVRALCMGREGWKVGEGGRISGLEWSGMASRRRGHPGQRKCPELQNMAGDGQKSMEATLLRERCIVGDTDL